MSRKWIQPLSAVLLLTVGVLVGFKVKDFSPVEVTDRELTREENVKKFQSVVNRVADNYFKEVDVTEMVDNAIQGMLEKLDPHTFYIPPPDLKNITEQMQGSFEGIGVEFNIIEDTVLVVTPLSGGPSDRLGIMPGDRVIAVEGENVAGVGISNSDVVKKLRGPKGSTVNVEIYRPGYPETLDFAIVRDKIPLNSVDFSYMMDEETGYLKVNRFSETTMREFIEHLMRLKSEGMENLILDLRFNPGGYLEMAQMMADVFLKRGQMIVYTDGRISGTDKEYVATSRLDQFEKGGLIVLINQGSASASEIVSGAVQDHDRGLVVGQRSFGKGLVQQQYQLLDGSAVRVVVSRYYTPAGRCIQKPFEEGEDAYNQEVAERFESGEIFHPDQIEFPDSLKFKTDHGRTVYGGGGIMPDVYVTPDTAGGSEYLRKLSNKNLFYRFAFRYAEGHEELRNQYPTGMDFALNYEVTEALRNAFVDFGKENDVEFDAEGLHTSRAIIDRNLKALLARQLYNDEGYYPALNSFDPVVQRAIQLMPKAVILAQTGQFEVPSFGDSTQD